MKEVEAIPHRIDNSTNGWSIYIQIPSKKSYVMIAKDMVADEYEKLNAKALSEIVEENGEVKFFNTHQVGRDINDTIFSTRPPTPTKTFGYKEPDEEVAG